VGVSFVFTKFVAFGPSLYTFGHTTTASYNSSTMCTKSHPPIEGIVVAVDATMYRTDVSDTNPNRCGIVVVAALF